MKKLLFVSNFNNHHQAPLAEEFVKFYGDGYSFIATTPFNQARVSAGYRDMNNEPYVLKAYESDSAMREAQKEINEAECVIIGAAPWRLVRERIKQGKLTFYYEERLFKGDSWKEPLKIIRDVICGICGMEGWLRSRVVFPRGAKTYLLCSSAFCSNDYKFFGFDPSRCYKWGYFPQVKRYDYEGGQIPRIETPGIKNYPREQGQASCGRADSSHGNKKPIQENLSKGAGTGILWAGRFLAWKHPELAVQLADNLKRAGRTFTLKMIGAGECYDDIARMIDEKNLRDCVTMTGALPFEQVRTEMENADIFLFTSDYKEGWGAVLNESMNSGCAVVASDRIGSVPFLVKHGHNGLIFHERDVDDLTRKVTSLLDDPAKTAELGRNAYRTMIEEWNPEVVAKRFIELSDALNHGRSGSIFADGPLSPAALVRDDWFKNMD